MPMRRRTSTGSTPWRTGPRRGRGSRPSTRVPGIRSFIRLIVRSSVDLPQPGRADERGDALRLERDGDVAHGAERRRSRSARPRRRMTGSTAVSASAAAGAGRSRGRGAWTPSVGRGSVAGPRSSSRRSPSAATGDMRAVGEGHGRLQRAIGCRSSPRPLVAVAEEDGDGIGEERDRPAGRRWRPRQAPGTRPAACAPSRRR